MTRLRNLFFVAILAFAWPMLSLAAGLVPCGGSGQESCQTCHLATLVNGVIEWLLLFLGTVAAILITYAGAKLVTSGGNGGAMEKAKSMISNILIGYVIILAAWLLVDTGMKMLLTDGETKLGMWNQISCVDQPNPEWVGEWSNPDASLSGINGWNSIGGQSTEAECGFVSGPAGQPTSQYDCSVAIAQCTNAGGKPVVSTSGNTVLCEPAQYGSGSGSGSCEVVTDPSNACYPDKLTCFPDRNLASEICNLESRGGNTSIMSGTDLCQDGKSFSVGLWQINILANSHLLPGCNKGFFTSDNNGQSEGGCIQWTYNSNGLEYCEFRSCNITNVPMYNHCVYQAKNSAINTSAACSLMSSQGWSAWATSYNECR